MTTAKKTHWLRTTLLVLIACGIIGVIWAAVSFNADPGRTYASATLQFSFNGAGQGKGPNGYPFNTNGIFSDEVIGNALAYSALEGTYTVDQIRENLSVTANYPENIVKQMTAYNSLLDANADQQAALTDYHPTSFSVHLGNDFDPHIASGQLTGLLNHLLEAYRAYFAAYNSVGMNGENPIPELSAYDYAQQLTAISETSAQQQRYAQEMAELAPDFMQDRKGFDDILISYEALDSGISRLNASVALNALSKDRDRLQKQYEMEVRTLTRRIEGEQEELDQIEKMVSAYDKDDILYVSTSDAIRKVDSNSSVTYDKLVERKKKLTDAIAADKAEISMYEALLADMAASGSNAGGATAAAAEENEATAANPDEAAQEEAVAAAELTEEELKALGSLTEKQLEALQAKRDAVTAQFTAMLDAYTAQEVNERTVSVSGLSYVTPSLLSGVFIMRAIKTAGPLCALGFMACILLLVIHRWREGKAGKA